MKLFSILLITLIAIGSTYSVYLFKNSNRTVGNTTLTSSALVMKSSENETKKFAPKIKGVYIGMDIRSAKKILEEELADTNQEDLVCKDESGNLTLLIVDKDSMRNLMHKLPAISMRGKPELNRDVCNYILKLEESPETYEQMIRPAYINFKFEYWMVAQISSGVRPVSIIKSNPDYSIINIELIGDLVDCLFKSSHMDAVDFIKKFETSYNIPTFEKKPFFVDGSDLSSYIYTSPEGIKITINSCK